MSKITAEERDRVAALARAKSCAAAAQVLGIGPESVARIVSDLPIRRGTVALLRAALARLDGAQNEAA